MCDSLPVCLPAFKSRALEGQGLTHAEQPSGVHILLALGSNEDMAFYRHLLWSSSDIRGVRYLPRSQSQSRANPTGTQTWPFPRLLPCYCPAQFSKFSLERQVAHQSPWSSVPQVEEHLLPPVYSWSHCLPSRAADHRVRPIQVRKEGTYPWAPGLSWELTQVSFPPGSPRGFQQAKLSILTIAISQSPRLTSPSQ